MVYIACRATCSSIVAAWSCMKCSGWPDAIHSATASASRCPMYLRRVASHARSATPRAARSMPARRDRVGLASPESASTAAPPRSAAQHSAQHSHSVRVDVAQDHAVDGRVGDRKVPAPQPHHSLATPYAAAHRTVPFQAMARAPSECDGTTESTPPEDAGPATTYHGTPPEDAGPATTCNGKAPEDAGPATACHGSPPEDAGSTAGRARRVDHEDLGR
jgi:hypothetical protein